ncbi:MAG: hypothetical protein AB8G05_08440 [Oligoflexales bacterium]
MKQQIMGMYLDERDILLFKYLHAVKAATYEQITRDVFSDITQESLGNRIRKLEDNRLVQIQRSRLLLKGKRIVSNTKKSFENFVRRGNEKRIEIKSDSVHHDVALVDIRHSLLNSNKTKYYTTENEIQTWGTNEACRLNSDAIVTTIIQSEAVELPIEYECTLKMERRYDDFLKKYYNSDIYPLILFISDSQSICNKVMGIERELFSSDQPKFFYQVSNLLLKNESLQFKNYHNAILTL